MKLIVKKGSLKLPGSRNARLRQGQAVPAGALDEASIHRLINAGVLSLELPGEVGEVQPLPPTRGRWQHDPASLAGKSLLELRAMVLDVDAEMDVDELPEAALVQLLTSDFEPVFSPPETRASDRHRPSDARLREARRKAV